MNLACLAPAYPVALAPSSQGRELWPSLARVGLGFFLGAHKSTPLTSSETSRASMALTFRRAHSSVVMCGPRFAHCGSKRNLTNAPHAKKDSTHPG